ncbi:hypothetical protein AR685_03660 [Chryseobacterium sp. JAH]|nr:hypothetical protein AR685_03660 [Chryseobacterium sp. JAH]
MPLGTAEFGDAPDVTYRLPSGKIIGIEITEAVYDEKSIGSREGQIKFNYDVIEKLKDELPFKFVIDITLNTKIKLKQNNRKLVIENLKKFCVKEFASLNSYETIHFENLELDWSDLNNEIKKQLLAQGYRKLPIEISTIAITRNDNITNSTHMESTFGVIPDFTDENLDKILAKKNNSLKKYKLCDEQWLLIIEGWDFYSYYQEINITKKLQLVLIEFLCTEDLAPKYQCLSNFRIASRNSFSNINPKSPTFAKWN